MTSYAEVNEEVANRWPGWVAVKPLLTRADYDEAVTTLEALTGHIEGSPEEALYIVLVALTAAWEDEQAN